MKKLICLVALSVVCAVRPALAHEGHEGHDAPNKAKTTQENPATAQPVEDEGAVTAPDDLAPAESAPADTADAEPQKRKAPIELKDLVRSQSSRLLNALKTVLDIEPAQEASANGIQMTLVITNSGETAANIGNPIDFIHLYLYSRYNRPIALPRGHSRLLGECGGGEPCDFRLPFQVNSVELNGKMLTSKGWQDSYFELGAGGSLKIALGINRMIEKAWNPTTNLEEDLTGSLRANRYRFQVQFLLVDTKGHSRNLGTGLRPRSFVTVELSPHIEKTVTEKKAPLPDPHPNDE